MNILASVVPSLIVLTAGSALLAAPSATIDPAHEPTSSLMAQAAQERAAVAAVEGEDATAPLSMFAVQAPEIRKFFKHDLVQIIVRESSQAKSSHELETKKENEWDGQVNAWPDLNLSDLLNLQVTAGRTTALPELDLEFNRDFKGEGDYQRKDDLTARLTAEVIDILPNGNLVLEARTRIRTDQEESTMKVTGICRPDDVTPLNTILSNQIHDLVIEKVHTGELKKSSERGIISKVLDALFAF